MLVFRGVKNTGVRKNTNTPSCNASSIIPLWLRFFFYSGRFPKSVAFFFGTFFPAICRDLETFILQAVKTTTGDLFQWIRCFRFR